MTENMKKFAEIAKKVEDGTDYGSRYFENCDVELGKVVAKKYGEVYMAFTKVNSIGELKFKPMHTHCYLPVDMNERFYVESCKFNSIPSCGSDTSVSKLFAITVVHKMKRLRCYKFDYGFDGTIWVEDGISIFATTYYGFVDIFNALTEIRIEKAIETIFEGEEITIVPSSKSKFSNKVSAITRDLINDNIEFIDDIAKVEITIDYKPLRTYYSAVIDDDGVDIYIGDRCIFENIRAGKSNFAKITISSNFSKDITFDTVTSVYGLKCKVSSKFLGKFIRGKIAIDSEVVSNYVDMDMRLFKGINFSKTRFPNVYDDIKNDTYPLIINAKHSFMSELKRAIFNEAYNSMAFTCIKDSKLMFEKAIVQKYVDVPVDTPRYRAFLYKERLNDTAYDVFKIDTYIVEDKINSDVFFATRVSITDQLCLTELELSIPVVYFKPLTAFFGNNLHHKEFYLNMYEARIRPKAFYEMLYGIVIKEFGDIRLDSYITTVPSWRMGPSTLKELYESRKLKLNAKFAIVNDEELDSTFYLKLMGDDYEDDNGILGNQPVKGKKCEIQLFKGKKIKMKLSYPVEFEKKYLKDFLTDKWKAIKADSMDDGLKCFLFDDYNKK